MPQGMIAEFRHPGPPAEGVKKFIPVVIAGAGLGVGEHKRWPSQSKMVLATPLPEFNPGSFLFCSQIISPKI